MPVIPLNFDGVQTFDNLPEGRYYGSIDKVEFRAANDPSKSDQLMVTYLVIDGDHTGRKSSEFLSFSPKAVFRMKRWFDKFGLADDLESLDIDDDTNLLMDPDLVGVNVVFRVRKDGQYQGEDRIRTELVEVVDEPAPAPAPAPRKAKAPAPAEDEDEMDADEALAASEASEEETKENKRRQFAPRPAATQSARRRI